MKNLSRPLKLESRWQRLTIEIVQQIDQELAGAVRFVVDDQQFLGEWVVLEGCPKVKSIQ